MKFIPLTGEAVAIVDDEDHQDLSEFRWILQKATSGLLYAGRFDPGGGKTRKMPQRFIAMHRAILKAGPSEAVDHKNGDGLDNRRVNLRLCTLSQNQRNRRKITGSSQYKGVCWNRNCKKWQAQIKIASGKSMYLGIFENELDAARAYDSAALEHFGEFAATNAEILGVLA